MNLVVAALLILSHTLPHLGQFNLDPPVIKQLKYVLGALHYKPFYNINF